MNKKNNRKKKVYNNYWQAHAMAGTNSIVKSLRTFAGDWQHNAVENYSGRFIRVR